ncbi:hypothetical protein X777_06259 [Ooceraea biroi]|uniref:Uncharacterized protein n=1 Tax=Ooceraea biroi TaxID=2015173 RepID=A0A026WAV2_OOCBI|nr:hypothetical protein X777_06259 [Ooceraea biroi]
MLAHQGILCCKSSSMATRVLVVTTESGNSCKNYLIKRNHAKCQTSLPQTRFYPRLSILSLYPELLSGW